MDFLVQPTVTTLGSTSCQCQSGTYCSPNCNPNCVKCTTQCASNCNPKRCWQIL